MGSILNYLIGIALLAYMAYNVRQKSIKNPKKDFGGFSAKTILTMAYIGMACFGILLINELLKP